MNNLEFNVELRDRADVTFALERFEELWQHSVPVEEAYVQAIEKRTWLRSDITPYENIQRECRRTVYDSVRL